jgi:ubiquinone/menaquinone biosynthesis C-methylase UbiE
VSVLNPGAKIMAAPGREALKFVAFRLETGPLACINRLVSTENIYSAVLRVADRHGKAQGRKHLDIGSGNGQLVRLFKERYRTESSACDYTDTLMKVPGQKVDIVNLNTEHLPYPDATFDIVTATEVIEHLEHYRETLRDIYRVLKPGGLCVLTTPNILNINSRLRFAWFGFWNLFGPLPVKNSRLYSTGGHINPVSYFYIAHSLYDAGFDNLAVTVDKRQRSGIFKLIFFYLPIQFFGILSYNKEVRKYRTIDEHNASIVKAMNSTDLLLGRTVVVSGVK